MTAPNTTGHIGLSVSNIGPIRKADIELRPMTVFVGPSNTGKSYLAVLIYALHQFFGAYSGYAGYRSLIAHLQDLELSKQQVNDINAWVSESMRITKPKRPETDQGELPRTVSEPIYQVLNDVSYLREYINDEISRCFGLESVRSLVRYPKHSDSRLTVFSVAHNSPGQSDAGKPSQYVIDITDKGAEISAYISKDTPLQTSQNVEHLWNSLYRRGIYGEEEKERNAVLYIYEVIASTVSNITAPLSHPAHYLPADRTGIMHAHQLAVRGLIANASHAGLRQETPMPVLSGVLTDFLEQLVSLPRPTYQREVPDREELADRLEEKIMQGAIRVESSQIDYPSFVYQPSGWQDRSLPLTNTSSMVSELSPVALYLRHIVRTGDMLIIEEPESHLHPEMQVEFVRQLARVVRSGIRILITTHSEWVLEELANLVRLSELPSERRVGIEDADVTLHPDEVGTWFFEPSHDPAGGSVVREIKLDTEAGIFPSGFGLVTESLYNRWAEISNRIEEDR